jgi:hypothetical protein
VSSDQRQEAAGGARIGDLQEQARYHRDRYRLYRAKVHGRRPASLARLRELERVAELAESRLRRAQRGEAAS